MRYLSEGVDSGRPDVSFVYKAELLMPSCELGFGLAGDMWLWRQKDMGSNHDSVIHFLRDFEQSLSLSQPQLFHR